MTSIAKSTPRASLAQTQNADKIQSAQVKSNAPDAKLKSAAPKDTFEAGGKTKLPQQPGAAMVGKMARAGDLLSALRAGADPSKAVDILGMAPLSPDQTGIGGAGQALGGDVGAAGSAGAGPDALENLGAATTPARSGRDALLTEGLTSPTGGGESGQPDPTDIGGGNAPQRGNMASGLMADGNGGSGPENWHMESSMTDTSNSEGGQSVRQETKGTNVDTGESITDVSTHDSDGKGNSTETNEVTQRDADGNVTAHEKTTTKTDADGNTTTTTESNTDGGGTEGGGTDAGGTDAKDDDLTHEMEPGGSAPRPTGETLKRIFGDGTGPSDEETNPNPDGDDRPTVSDAEIQDGLKRRTDGLVNPSEPGTGGRPASGPTERNRDPVINPAI